MRLIDADALNKRLCETTIFIKGGEMFQRMINDAPTVDAVEVIRCEDCKWSDWYKTLNGEHRCYCMEHGSLGHTDDDYCSYGER